MRLPANIYLLLFVAFFLGFLTFPALATTYYVDINSINPTPPYTNWSTASTDIQSAINQSTNGDLVLVADGTYSTGTTNANGDGNRIFLNQAITVESVNGPATTIIRGQSYADNLARGACLAAGASLIGFTVTAGDSPNGGGGVYCQSSSCVLSNCVVTGNTELINGGGGVWGGTLYNCTINNNSGGERGGGVSSATLFNCTIGGNTAAGTEVLPGYGGGVEGCTCFNCILSGNTAENFGGGEYDSTLNNCLVTGNYCFDGPGGGAEGGTLNNCTVSGNTAISWPGGGVDGSTANNTISYGNNPDDIDASTVNFCCATSLSGGSGNINANPDFESDSYQLQYDSPCIGAGNTNYVTTATDLNGNPRIVNGTVDMGAYEFQPQTITIITEPLSQTIPGGQSVSFTISAACEEALTYQWQFDGTNIAGAGGTNLMLTDIQSSNAGTYDVIISDSQLSVTSSSAGLVIIYPPPVIVQEPTNLVVSPGSNAFFSANAISYYPITFQWQFDGTNLSDGEQITGSTNSVLNISDAQPANIGQYQVIVANDYGSVTSTVAILNVGPYTRYVNLNNPTPAYPYLSWNTAATDIQTAINACLPGDQVVVTDGVYQSSGYLAPDKALTCVVVTNALTLQSVNGENATFINGSNAMRCLYLGNGSTLTGFTLINGTNWPSAGNSANGGGVYCQSTNVLLADCLIMSNSAAFGGGVYSGTLINCTLTGNRCAVLYGGYFGYGGGAYGSVLNNCLLNYNVATNYGGGANICTLNNCFLNNNSANNGGGAANSTLINCIVSNNVAHPIGISFENQGMGGGAYDCTTLNCLIISNSALYYLLPESSGGGAYNGMYGEVVSNCVFQGNWAAVGGGVLGGPTPIVNCVFIGNGAIAGGGANSANLIGCTFNGNWATNGGGADNPVGSTSYVITNCTFTGNLATNYGGGYYGNEYIYNCLFNGNIAFKGGGGVSGGSVEVADSIFEFNSSPAGGAAYEAFLNNCLIVSNNASSIGGGSQYAFLNSCTVVGNSSGGTGGGVSGASPINNCIIYYNTAVSGGSNTLNIVMNNCCTTPDSTSSGNNIITNAPLFMDASAGNFHLQSNSPCINSGNNAYASGSTDLDGNPRIVGGTVDIGCYEYQSPVSMVSYAWLEQYGLPITTNTDTSDPNGTGFDVYQDWIAGLNPTNPASVLVMLPVTTTNTTSGITVTWQSVSGILYNLQRSTNLAAQPPFSTIQANITGQAGTTSYKDTSATNGIPYFYRVGVP